jgi:hypothetical protein
MNNKEKDPKKLFSFTILSYSVLIIIIISVLSTYLYYNFQEKGTLLSDAAAKKNLDIALYCIPKELEQKHKKSHEWPDWRQPNKA